MQPSVAEPDSLLEPLIALCRAAGDIVMAHYAASGGVAATKSDGSPVTLADHEAEALLTDGLQRLTPGTTIVAEEAVAEHGAPDRAEGPFWLVDPLDGTREFLARNGEFTVNVALIVKRRPVLGVVLAPALGSLFAGVAGRRCFAESGGGRRPISVRDCPPQGLTVVASRSHGDERLLNDYLAGRRVAQHTTAGSSLKFCLIAAGEADLYPRFGRTMEWDTAAGHAVLLAAGGSVRRLDGSPLEYGKPGFENPAFVAFGAEPGDAGT